MSLRWRSPLSWSISAYIYCCLLFRVEKISRWVVFDRRPIQNRPHEGTNLLCLAKFEYQPNHRFAVVLYCCTAVCSTVHHVWVCHKRMMMLPAVACAAGHGCRVVCVICMFTLLFTHGFHYVVLYTWLGVCSREGRNTNSLSEM